MWYAPDMETATDDETRNGGFVRPPIVPGIEHTLRNAFELNKERMAAVEERELALKDEETAEVILVHASSDACNEPSNKRPKVETTEANDIAQLLTNAVAGSS